MTGYNKAGVKGFQARPFEDRFWEKGTSPASAGNGRAFSDVVVMATSAREGKAHRVSYELAHGPISDGLWVLHRCDNPRCVKPEHLFLGTHSDNMHDMITKGRAAKRAGNSQNMAKLNEDLVREIRHLVATGGISLRAIGRRYGVGHGAIRCIINGQTWKHVEGA